MLVAPQSIEATLVARRLQRWGGATYMVSDLAVALALLPERTWHAVLIDRALGTEEVEQLAEAARGHATQRIVNVDACRRGTSCSPPPPRRSQAIWSNRCARPRSRPG